MGDGQVIDDYWQVVTSGHSTEQPHLLFGPVSLTARIRPAYTGPVRWAGGYYASEMGSKRAGGWHGLG